MRLERTREQRPRSDRKPLLRGVITKNNAPTEFLLVLLLTSKLLLLAVPGPQQQQRSEPIIDFTNDLLLVLVLLLVVVVCGFLVLVPRRPESIVRSYPVSRRMDFLLVLVPIVLRFIQVRQDDDDDDDIPSFFLLSSAILPTVLPVLCLF